MKKIGFLSFGHWTASPRSQTRSAADALLQSIDLAVAAEELGVAPAGCLVIEDASAGILAARAGGMLGLGIARLADAALLRSAGADLVVSSLDEVDVDALVAGRLATRNG